MFKRLAAKNAEFGSALLDPGPDLLIVDEGHMYLTSGGAKKKDTQVTQ
jgi:hypothetical protein